MSSSSSPSTPSKNIAPISDAQGQLLEFVSLLLNAVALAVCLGQFVFHLILRSKRPQLVNRIWLRLIAAVAFGNILYHAVQLVSGLVVQQGHVCSAFVLLFVFFTHLTVFLTAGIAFNLHLIVRQRATSAKPTVEVEVWYYVVPVLGAMSFAMPGWWFEAYGYDQITQTCYFVDPQSIQSLLWQWFSLYGPIMLVTLYCFIIVFLVVFKLLRRGRELSREIRTSQLIQNTQDLKKSIRKAMQKADHARQLRQEREHMLISIALRVARYPAIPLISQTGNVIYGTYLTVTKTSSFSLLFLATVGTSIQGILYFILFCVDPGIQQTWADLRGKSKKSTVDQAQGYPAGTAAGYKSVENIHYDNLQAVRTASPSMSAASVDRGVQDDEVTLADVELGTKTSELSEAQLDCMNNSL